jgi:hypothetical protein
MIGLEKGNGVGEGFCHGVFLVGFALLSSQMFHAFPLY